VGPGLGLVGPILTVIFCEIYKFISKSQVKAFADKVRRQLELEEKARLEGFAHHQSVYVNDESADQRAQEAPPQLK